MKLDMHCEMILDKYRKKLPVFEKLRSIVTERLQQYLDENHIIVAGIDSASRPNRASPASWS